LSRGGFAVGFIEERNAGDAIAALKSQLAPQCHVCRGGEWRNMPARLLVPGGWRRAEREQ
jgi:H+-transporting ATPase